MKRIIVLVTLLVGVQATFGQDAGGAQATPEGWDLSTTTTLGVGQMSFNSNWAAGSTNVFSANGNAVINLNYLKDVDKTARTAFVNTVSLNYGIQKPEGFGIQKSADNLRMSSMLARRISSDNLFDGDALYIGASASLYTQISPGYLLTFVDGTGSTAYFGVAPNTINPVTGRNISPRKGLKVSSFMSPGYVWLRAGLRYLFQVGGKDAIYLQFAPISIKQTYVIDNDIRLSSTQADDPAIAANYDIYGTADKTVSSEAGSTTDLNVRLPLAMVSPALQNLFLAADGIVFVSYDDPAFDFLGNFVLQGKINEYFTASVATDIVYNNKIDTDFSQTGTQTGLQLMGVVNIGLTLKF